MANTEQQKNNYELSQEKAPSALLDSLAKEISKKYLVRLDTISKFLKNETKSSLENIKAELKKEEKKEKAEETPSDTIIQEIYNAIEWAKEILKQSTQISIEQLKEQVWKGEKSDTSYLKKLLPENIYKRVTNPENFIDEITWLCLWVAESGETLVRTLISIGKWILTTPRDLYLIISWKWEYKIPNI